MRFLISVYLLLGLSNPSQSQNNHLDSLESVLNRLEKNLMEQEAQMLPGDNPKHIGPKRDVKKIQESINLSSLPSELEELQEFKAATRRLGASVERLSSDIEKMSLTLQEKAKFLGETQISVQLPAREKYSIQYLRVAINGFEIANYENNAAIWQTSMNVPIFKGPLNKGQHRIDCEVRLINLKNPIPMNSQNFQIIQKSFHHAIADPGIRQNLVLSFLESHKNLKLNLVDKTPSPIPGKSKSKNAPK